VVIRAQAELQVFKFVIAQSTFTNIPDLVTDVVPLSTGLPSFPFAPMIVFFAERQTGIDVNAVNSVNELQRFNNTPILIMHGTKDDWIPFAQGQALYESAKEPKQFYAIEDAPHFPVYVLPLCKAEASKLVMGLAFRSDRPSNSPAAMGLLTCVNNPTYCDDVQRSSEYLQHATTS
jgi:fermentation-respiration switch protein FrsA (DUF1100 family)